LPLGGCAYGYADRRGHDRLERSSVARPFRPYSCPPRGEPSLASPDLHPPVLLGSRALLAAHLVLDRLVHAECRAVDATLSNRTERQASRDLVRRMDSRRHAARRLAPDRRLRLHRQRDRLVRPVEGVLPCADRIPLFQVLTRIAGMTELGWLPVHPDLSAAITQARGLASARQCSTLTRSSRRCGQISCCSRSTRRRRWLPCRLRQGATRPKRRSIARSRRLPRCGGARGSGSARWFCSRPC